MVDLDSLLDEATPASMDISICLDGAMQQQREALAQRAMARPVKAEDDTDGRLGKKPDWQRATDELRELEERMRERLLVIRIIAMPGTQWAALKGRHKPKSDRDKQHGFNLEAVARDALVTHGKRVDGETLVDITAEQWRRIFDKITGGDVEQLIYATLGVNQLAGAQVVASLSKGSPVTPSSGEK